jgi:indole-3-acetate monooxygenase
MTHSLHTQSIDRDQHKLDYLHIAQSLSPMINGDAEEIERTKTLTPRVLDALKSSGLCEMMLAKEYGGGAIRLVDALDVVAEISRADASTGWAFLGLSFGAPMVAGLISREGAEFLWGGTYKHSVAGQAAPIGTAVEVPGGLRVTGHWQFGSGVEWSDYIGGGVTVVDSAGNALTHRGQPDARWAFMPRQDVTIIPNWNVSGMAGTGSHDYEVNDYFVPEHLIIRTFTGDIVRDEGLYQLGLANIVVAGHAAMVLGVAQRSLQELVTITACRARTGYPGLLKDYPVFQLEFAKADADYRSARAYVWQVFSDAEDYGDRHGSMSAELLARMRQAGSYAHHAARRVVGFARRWAGTAGYRNPSVIGRVCRDADVMVTHLYVDDIRMTTLAPALMDAHKQ